MQAVVPMPYEAASDQEPSVASLAQGDDDRWVLDYVHLQKELVQGVKGILLSFDI
jgi:hypothetical protein